MFAYGFAPARCVGFAPRAAHLRDHLHLATPQLRSPPTLGHRSIAPRGPRFGVRCANGRIWALGGFENPQAQATRIWGGQNPCAGYAELVVQIWNEICLKVAQFSSATKVAVLRFHRATLNGVSLCS